MSPARLLRRLESGAVVGREVCPVDGREGGIDLTAEFDAW
jgi:hypothetical protein